MHTDMQILYIMIYHHQHICKVPQVYSSLTLYVQCPPAIHLIAPTNFVLLFCGVLHDTTPNTWLLRSYCSEDGSHEALKPKFD